MEMKGKKSYKEYSSSSISEELGYQKGSNSYSFNGPCSTSNPEVKRKKRIASYNLLATEEKLKSSLRNSFKWIKSKFAAADNFRYGL